MPSQPRAPPAMSRHAVRNQFARNNHDYLCQGIADHIQLMQRREQMKRRNAQLAGRAAQRPRAGPSEKQHCVRCHKTFVEANNHRGACVVEHDPEGLWDEDGDPHGCGGTCKMWWNPRSANCSFRGHPECPDYCKPCCFEGKHTADPSDVFYNDVTIRTCEEEGCGSDADDDE